MELIVHHTISDLYRSLNLPIEQDLDFTIHFLPDLHKSTPFASPVFRAEYFSFVFVKDGKGSYTTDEKHFPFGPRTIYFTNPGHVKSFKIEELSDVYIITLTEHFLRTNVHADIFREFPFLLAETIPPKTLSVEEFAEFEGLYKQLYSEFAKNSSLKEKILGNLFVVILLKIKEKFWSAYDPLEEGDRNSEIVRSFKQLLEEQFTHLTDKASGGFHQVQDFAQMLNLHPNYLSHVIKSKTGKPVNDWIQERMLSAAKNLLTHTSLSSKEIGYRLGFSEPTHFSRFFKKHTTLSPIEFKKSLS